MALSSFIKSVHDSSLLAERTKEKDEVSRNVAQGNEKMMSLRQGRAENAHWNHALPSTSAS
jgi:hypothetical protein